MEKSNYKRLKWLKAQIKEHNNAIARTEIERRSMASIELQDNTAERREKWAQSLELQLVRWHALLVELKQEFADLGGPEFYNRAKWLVRQIRYENDRIQDLEIDLLTLPKPDLQAIGAAAWPRDIDYAKDRLKKHQERLKELELQLEAL